MSDIFSPPEWIEARPYQQQAVDSWAKAGGSGVLRMATGTGKTITGLLAAVRAASALEGRLLLVVAAPYQHLVDQWADEIREFGAEPVFAYQSRKDWQPRLERQILEYNQGSRGICTVVTSHNTVDGGCPINAPACEWPSDAHCRRSPSSWLRSYAEWSS